MIRKEGGVRVSAAVVVWLMFAIILCLINGAIAASKNRSVLGWVLLTLVFGLVATLVLCVIPKVDDDGSWMIK
jgi:hypothetical protein